MKLLIPVARLLFLLAAAQSFAGSQVHSLPDTNAVAMTIAGNCGALDVAPVDRGGYKRCADMEFAAYEKVRRLSEDKAIPDPVWNSCWAASSARNVSFRMWEKCLDVAKANCSLQKAYVGLGVYWVPQDGQFITKEFFGGSSAEKSGLAIGDILRKVGTEEVSGLTPEQLTLLVKRQVGATVALTIRAPDRDHDQTVVIKRNRISMPDTEGVQNCWIWIQSGKWIGR